MPINKSFNFPLWLSTNSLPGYRAGKSSGPAVWEIVWGPAVWKFRPDDADTGSDDVFFVVKNPSLAFSNGEKQETYVLAIAGTQTRYNWAVNNGIVDEVVNFHEWLKRGITTRPEFHNSTSPENCHIALGTAPGLLSERFPKVPGPRYELRNCMMVNLLDPIPQVWCTSKEKSPKQNMSNIPAIYGEPVLLEVWLGVAAGRALANASAITYIPLQAAWFEGDPPSPRPANLEAFFKVLWQQHTGELLKLMGIERIQDEEVLTGEEEGLQRMSDMEVARTEPFMCELMAQVDAQEAEEGGASEDCKSLRVLSEGLVM
ncbi:hypothetical protein RSAG8_05554, partial [Rhizoctonia solani AG-8 WAC10335]